MFPSKNGSKVNRPHAAAYTPATCIAVHQEVNGTTLGMWHPLLGLRLLVQLYHPVAAGRGNPDPEQAWPR
jgi:hypothetical protein